MSIIIKIDRSNPKHIRFVDHLYVSIRSEYIIYLIGLGFAIGMNEMELELTDEVIFHRERSAPYITFIHQGRYETKYIRLYGEEPEYGTTPILWRDGMAKCKLCSKDTPSFLAKGVPSHRLCFTCFSYFKKEPLSGVYLIWAVDTFSYKIGYSNNVEARLSSLKTGSPIELWLIAVFPGSMSDEKYTHKLFDQYRFNLEWFKFPSDKIESILDFFRVREATFTEDGETFVDSILFSLKNEWTPNPDLYSESFVM